jgi:hypothetical protein
MKRIKTLKGLKSAAKRNKKVVCTICWFGIPIGSNFPISAKFLLLIPVFRIIRLIQAGMWEYTKIRRNRAKTHLGVSEPVSMV